MRSKFDLVIGSTPHPFAAIAAWIVSRLSGIPLVSEVRDLWPESLVSVGVATEKSILYKLLASIMSYLYRSSRLLVGATMHITKVLTSHVAENGTVVFLPNGIDFDGLPKFEENATGPSVTDKNTFSIAYVGTVGMAHDVMTILRAAEILKQEPWLKVTIVGDGAEKETVAKYIYDHKLQNVILEDMVERSKALQFLMESDAALVTLKKDVLFEGAIPFKLLEAMGLGKPILLGIQGEAQEIVEKARAGIAFEPGNPESLAQAIRAMAHDEQGRKDMSASAKAYIQENFNRTMLAERYLNHLKKVIAV